MMIPNTDLLRTVSPYEPSGRRRPGHGKGHTPPPVSHRETHADAFSVFSEIPRKLLKLLRSPKLISTMRG